MGLDRLVRGGNHHAGQHKLGSDLVLTENELVLLIHATTDQLASAGSAGTCMPGKGQFDGLIKYGI